MVIKKIFSTINNKESKNNTDIDIDLLNKAKPKNLTTKNEEDESGDANFIDGLQIFFTEDGVFDGKKINILQNEEGSNTETFKNPKMKNKSKDDEIYSDFTDKPFLLSKESKKEDIEEFKITPTVDLETGESKATINKSKKTKKTYNRGF